MLVNSSTASSSGPGRGYAHAVARPLGFRYFESTSFLSILSMLIVFFLFVSFLLFVRAQVLGTITFYSAVLNCTSFLCSTKTPKVYARNFFLPIYSYRKAPINERAKSHPHRHSLPRPPPPLSKSLTTTLGESNIRKNLRTCLNNNISLQ